MTKQPQQPRSGPRRLLRHADQAAVAMFVLAGLGAMVGWYATRGGWQGRLIELDRAEPLPVHFEVDINSAAWPELAQLPGIGETIARRIIDSRREEGPFHQPTDLRRVRGIGPKTLDRIRPYLGPMSKPSEQDPD